MQWYKGNHKIKEGVKFTSKYIELSNWEFEVLLEISVRLLPNTYTLLSIANFSLRGCVNPSDQKFEIH